MRRIYSFGHIAGLKISARPSALFGFLILWVLISSAFRWLVGIRIETALVGGFAGACLHFASELWHSLSHALAARKSGYPMTGIVFWLFLATTRYPSSEGPLPARTHLQRAIGGPVGSLLLAILFTIVALSLKPGASMLWWLVAFAAADNLLVFTLGALLPLGFTDGSTILYWISKETS